jgi:tungstate transport system permease protein
VSIWDTLIETLNQGASTGSELLHIILLTLRVSGLALLISAVAGIPAGAWLGVSRFRGRRVVVAAIYTGMGLPPVVVGLAVYMILSRSGPLGDLGWLFTPAAMVTAQILLAMPLIIGLTNAAIESLDADLRLQLRSMGANRLQEIGAMLGEARDGVIAAVAAGFGGIVSEVGAAMLAGGNIEAQTRVLSTAIVLETRRGNFALALALGGVLLSLTFAVSVLLIRLRHRAVWTWK